MIIFILSDEARLTVYMYVYVMYLCEYVCFSYVQIHMSNLQLSSRSFLRSFAFFLCLNMARVFTKEEKNICKINDAVNISMMNVNDSHLWRMKIVFLF